MKIYVHYDEHPQFTHLAKCGPENPGGPVTVRDLRQAFVAAFNLKHGTSAAMRPDDLQLLRNRGGKWQTLPLDASLAKTVKDRWDIYAVPAGTTPATGETPRGSATGSGHLRAPPGGTDGDVDLPGGKKVAEEQWVKDALTAGLQAQRKEQFKLAASYFTTVRQVAPCNPVCLRALASMACSIARFDRAVPLLEQAVASWPKDVHFCASLAQAYYETGQLAPSLELYDRALALWTAGAHPAGTTQAPEILQASVPGQGSPAGEMDSECQLAGYAGEPVTLHGLKMGAARVLFSLGNQSTAASIVTAALQRDEFNVPALYEYGLILFHQGEVEEAMRAYLRILTKTPGHREARRQLAKIMQGSPKAMEMLIGELQVASCNSAALAFLASVIMQHGAVEQAATMLRAAVQLTPSSCGFILNLFHVLEILDRQCEALQVAADHLAWAPDVTVGPLRLGDCLPFLQGLPLHRRKCSSNNPLPHTTGVQLSHLRNYDLDRGDTSTVSPLPTMSASSSGGCDRMDATDRAEAIDGTDGISCSSNSAPTLSGRNDAPGGRSPQLSRSAPAVATPPPSKSAQEEAGEVKSRRGSSLTRKHEYGDRDLDELALLFSTCKALFVGGTLARAEGLAAVVQRAAEASQKALHETFVRNEAAYFGCIYQIMRDFPIHLPLPPAESVPPLYVAGDSHCLAPAWRVATLRGQLRMLTPLLVTGLKAWHLRPEGRFYPKVAFNNLMESLPTGAQIVVLFGEIDCREGLVTAVAKDRYKDLEEAVEVTGGIYVAAMLHLIGRKDAEVFVHPVPPVLPPTRKIVHLYNSVLKRQVEEASRKEPRLHWLDFFPDLLLPNGTLRPEYELDGTHLAPAYVTFLARELSEIQ